MASTLTSPGRALIALANLIYALGAFYMDYSETHVLNPRWPPHARFHNGQTMSLGLCLCSLVLYLLYSPLKSNGASIGKTTPSGQTVLSDTDAVVARERLFLAALVGSFYCAAGLSAIYYPGTAWADPEFVDPGQKWLFGGVVLLNWVGWGLEMGRMKGSGRKVKA